MLPLNLQFVVAMIASAINERMQRKLDYRAGYLTHPRGMMKENGVQDEFDRLPQNMVEPLCW